MCPTGGIEFAKIRHSRPVPIWTETPAVLRVHPIEPSAPQSSIPPRKHARPTIHPSAWKWNSAKFSTLCVQACISKKNIKNIPFGGFADLIWGVCCSCYIGAESVTRVSREGAGQLPALLLDQGSLLDHQAATSSNGPPKHGSGRTVSPRAEALPREERACNKIRASQRWSRKSLSARQGVCSSAAGAHHRRHSKL